jgi:hypothetical protein
LWKEERFHDIFGMKYEGKKGQWKDNSGLQLARNSGNSENLSSRDVSFPSLHRNVH